MSSVRPAYVMKLGPRPPAYDGKTTVRLTVLEGVVLYVVLELNFNAPNDIYLLPNNDYTC
jgi:hypothetical protein